MTDDSGLVEVNTKNEVALNLEPGMALFFDMHQKVNAKSEEISKSYNNNIIVEFSDLKELHLKTLQSIKALKPFNKSVSIRIAITHIEGESEKFNKFEDFEKHNSTSPSPTLAYISKYKFSILDDASEELENYEINLHLRSRIADIQELKKEAPPFVSNALFAAMVERTAKITIEYSDYVKARSFTAMFDEWIRGCNESKINKSIEQLKKKSHFIPNIGGLIIYGLLGFFTVIALNNEQINEISFLSFLVAYASVFVIIGRLANMVLRKLENSIDSYLPISYIKINKGDNKLIDSYKDQNSSAFKWSIISVIGTLCIGLLTSASYDIIKYLIE